jgi:hypothetical protein
MSSMPPLGMRSLLCALAAYLPAVALLLLLLYPAPPLAFLELPSNCLPRPALCSTQQRQAVEAELLAVPSLREVTERMQQLEAEARCEPEGGHRAHAAAGSGGQVRA